MSLLAESLKLQTWGTGVTWQTACVFVPSEKQADRVPEELFDAAAGQCVTTANFSKNQLTSIPSRYEDECEGWY